MSYADGSLPPKCRYKIKNQVFDKLFISYSEINSMTVFWNRYQIFVYENLNFEEPTVTLDPDFVIKKLICADNYLVCLDTSGNIYVTSLKFKCKNISTKRLKCSFQRQASSYASCVRYKQNQLICLSIENNRYYLNFHEISSDFKMIKKVLLNVNMDVLPLQDVVEKSILTCSIVDDYLKNRMSDIFLNKENTENKLLLFAITFDSCIVFSCLYYENLSGNEIPLAKLYSSPTEISGLQILQLGELNVLSSLKAGSLIKLSVLDNKKDFKAIHLNTAICKFIAYENKVLYTDARTMWLAESFHDDNIHLKQIFVKHPRDFIKSGERVIAVSFSQVIYTFSMQDPNIIIGTAPANFIASEKILDVTNNFEAILKEISKSAILCEELKSECNYVAAVALAKNIPVVQKVFSYSTTIYDSYEEVEITNLLYLTNRIPDYFEPHTKLLQLNVVIDCINKISDVLNAIIDDLRFHIILETNEQILKMVTLKARHAITDMFILVPFNCETVTDLWVRVKIVPGFPSKMDETQKLYVSLAAADLYIGSENFIKTQQPEKRLVHMKEPKETFENVIMESATRVHGAYSDINMIVNSRAREYMIPFYLKLPENYRQLFSNKEKYSQLSKARSEYILKSLCVNLMQGDIIWEIGPTQVHLKVINDKFCGHAIQILSPNVKVALNFKLFLSNIQYDQYQNFSPRVYYIPFEQYSIMENILTSMRMCLDVEDEEMIASLMEQYQKNIIGMLPM